MNRVILIGNLVKDPDMGKTSNDINVCKFTLAVHRKQNADGEREADFLPIITWRGLAENCFKYLKKGSKAAIWGSIQTRNYDAADGSKRYVTEIIADDVEFLSTGNKDSQEKIKWEPIDDDNLPF